MILIKTIITTTWDDVSRSVIWDKVPDESTADYIVDEHRDKVAQHNETCGAFQSKMIDTTVYNTKNLPDHMTMADLEFMPVRFLKYFV